MRRRRGSSPQQAVQGLLGEKQDPAGGLGREDGGELRRVVVEGGRAEEFPGPQQADGQGAVGHLDLPGEDHAQALPELAGAVEHLPGGEGLHRDAGQGGQGAEQSVLHPQEQGTAAQKGALLVREIRGHGRALLSGKVSYLRQIEYTTDRRKGQPQNIGWGEIIQGGMEMTDHCGPGRRKTQAGRRSDPEEMLAKVQAAAEEMTMRRYVHMPPEGRPCCPEGCLAALLGELNQIQDHQNQILAELLRALERMADALERR